MESSKLLFNKEWVWFDLRKDHFPTQSQSKLLPRGDGPFQIVKRTNDNAYELNLSNTYSGNNSFNKSDLTPFSTGVSNSWTNSLQPEEHDETLTDRASIKTTQPFRRMTRSMTQDSRLGQNHFIASDSAYYASEDYQK